MQLGTATGGGLAPAASSPALGEPRPLKEAESSNANRGSSFVFEDSSDDDIDDKPLAQWHVMTSAGGMGEGNNGGDEEDEEEELARAARGYVTKKHEAFIILSFAAAHKDQHARDLPADESLATWMPEVVTTDALVRQVVEMCQEKFPDKKAVFTEASVLRKYNGTRQRARGGKGKDKGGGQGPKSGKRLVSKQAKAARVEATAQRIALSEAGEREAAEEHVTWLAEGREALHRVTSGARLSDLRRILDVDDLGRVADDDDESMLSAAYDGLTALYGRVAERERDVEGALALAYDTFALRERLVATAPEQAWAEVHLQARQVCVGDADGIAQGMMAILPISRRRKAGDKNLRPGNKKGRVSQPQGTTAGKRVLKRTAASFALIVTSAQNAVQQLPAISVPNSDNLILQGSIVYTGDEVELTIACNDGALAAKLEAAVKKMVTDHVPAK